MVMKGKRGSLMKFVVIIIVSLFVLSTIGLSLISLTYTNVQAPTDEDIKAELIEAELMDWTSDNEQGTWIVDAVLVTGSFQE